MNTLFELNKHAENNNDNTNKYTGDGTMLKAMHSLSFLS